MCRASCKKTYKCVTRQQRMGEQSRLSTWPDVSVLTYEDDDSDYDASQISACTFRVLMLAALDTSM
jgi:hypothetical protein